MFIFTVWNRAHPVRIWLVLELRFLFFFSECLVCCLVSSDAGSFSCWQYGLACKEFVESFDGFFFFFFFSGFFTPALFQLYLFFLLPMLYEFRMQRVEMGICWMVSSSPQDFLTPAICFSDAGSFSCWLHGLAYEELQ